MMQAGKILQERYEIEKQIGQGGMGAVYVATDKRFGSKVAIKETLFNAEDFRRAFEREAQILNNMRHPALPRVSDYFSEDDKQFLVMEYIEGADLSEILKTHGAFEMNDVYRWADDLLNALDYLHTLSTPIIHRDIKPQNLKLTPRGEVILLDFGLAKGDLSQDSQHSNTKSLFGFSKAYAPLEQIQGNGTDLRSDLYSLAATLYHLATGKPAIDALARASSIINKNIDPLLLANEINPKIPFAFAEFLRKALSINADSRPNSAAAMRESLHQFAPAIEPRKATSTLTNGFISSAAFIGDNLEPESVVTNIENVESFQNLINNSNSVSFAKSAVDAKQVKPLRVDIEQRPIEQPEIADNQTTSHTQPKREFLGKSVAAIAVILALCGGGFAAWYAINKSKSAATQNPSQVQASKVAPTVTPTVITKNENTDKPAVAIAETTPTPEISPVTEIVKPTSKETAMTNKVSSATATAQTTQTTQSVQPTKTEEPEKAVVNPTPVRQTNVVRSQPTPQRQNQRETQNKKVIIVGRDDGEEVQEDEDYDSRRNNREDDESSDGQTRQRRIEERRQRRENRENRMSSEEIRRQRLEEVRRRNQQPF